MKQNITLSIEKRFLRQVRAVAAGQGMSVSVMLARDLQAIVEREAAYDQARNGALAQLESLLRLRR